MSHGGRLPVAPHSMVIWVVKQAAQRQNAKRSLNKSIVLWMGHPAILKRVQNHTYKITNKIKKWTVATNDHACAQEAQHWNPAAAPTVHSSIASCSCDRSFSAWLSHGCCKGFTVSLCNYASVSGRSCSESKFVSNFLIIYLTSILLLKANDLLSHHNNTKCGAVENVNSMFNQFVLWSGSQRLRCLFHYFCFKLA